MGDGEEMLSSNLTEPSSEEVNEPIMEEKNFTGEDLKNAEQCEFIHKVDSANESFASKENEAVALKDKFDADALSETAVEGPEAMQEAVAADGADVLETRMGSEAVVGGGDGLFPEEGDLHGGLVAEGAITVQSEMDELQGRSGDEKSNYETDDEPVLAAEGHKEVLAAETPALDVEMKTAVRVAGNTVCGILDQQLAGAESVIATEAAATVVNITDQQVEATVDGGQENVFDINVAQLAFAESVSVVEGNEVVGAESASVPEGNEVVGAESASVPESNEVGSGLTMVEGDKSMVELNKLQLPSDGPVIDEGVENGVVVPMDSSLEPMGTGKVEEYAAGLDNFAPKLDDVQIGGAEQPAGGKEVSAEELLTTENEVQIGGAEQPAEGKEIIAEELMTTETQEGMVTVGEYNTGLEGLQFVGNGSPRAGIEDKEEDGRGAEVQSVLQDNKMEEAIGMELSKENSSQLGGAESVVAARSNENREVLAEDEIPFADTQIEMETEAEAETIEGSDGDSVPKLDDSKVVPQEEEDEEMAAEEETVLADTEMETETDVGDSGKSVGGKRKRGKNSKITGNSKIASRARKIMDEDVCFICFDGGDLVLCDRRGCPKAYHPSCVNRDDAFFRAKGRWNCGWHICSICEKNAHYMCYTCTFSLCKGCIKNSVILCVRGNKGFCETCMRTVKLIENGDQSHKNAQIDFDDKSSWEFLFKDYYTELKSKLSLSSHEIAEAKNPWRGSDTLAVKEDSSEANAGNNGGGSGSENSTEAPEASKPKRRKGKKRLRSLAKEKDSTGEVVSIDSEGTSTASNAEWASKELLELVMHMKNGDKSVVSQFDVQALLLEYIKRNKLRDPRRKSQIICDARLENLFGKPRVGHFEMLKLLESHFLIKEESQTDEVQGSVVDTEVSQLEGNENADTLTKGTKDRKRKIRKRGDNRGPQSNRYDYAAIDMHNISLIYLRRKLMEDLLEDFDEFHSKVVGTFARIRISGNMQKQDLYRLVQVVGTSKAVEPYKVGKRTTYIMLEILNLNKTEIVSIDTISNQDFTEEECKRLRQSIKCGLLNRMTVGDILDKAMEVQAAGVNDWLESEIQRLSHLRDRASETGRKKELRECVEKLQILKTPEERMRRLEEIPQIHVDPNMDPNHESDESESETDDNRREVFLKTRSSGFSRRGRTSMSPGSDFSPKDSWNGGKIPSKNWELDRNFSSRSLSTAGEHAIQSDDLAKENAWSQGREKEKLDSDNFLKLSSSTKSENVGWNSHSVLRSESVSAVAAISSASLSTKEALPAVGSLNSSASLSTKETETAVKINETQKMWHYQDPSGKVQGPFSTVQLRKWSNTGYFPADLKIWRTNEKLEESILLTDALAGRFLKDLPSGESIISAVSALQAAHVLSGHSKKTSEISLQLAREGQLGEKSNIDQSHGAQTLQLGILKGSIAPSVEVPKLSTEKWSGSDLSNLPSPTPKHSNASETGNEGVLIHAASYHGGIQSSTADLPDHGNPSSLSATVLKSNEQLMRGPEMDSMNSGGSFSLAPNSEQNMTGSGISVQISSLNAFGEPQGVEKHSHLPGSQNNAPYPIQSVNSQNPHVENHGWSGPSSQKVETSPSTPMPGQPQAYSHWGAITPAVQNTAGGFSNSGASALPQSEFWGTPSQGNQPNMQSQGVPNLAWATGPAENNPSAPALRPENSNAGWAATQGAPNMGWVGPAPPGATNMNWGTTVQGPVPGNANSGWVMAPVNLGSNIQGPIAGNVNPGWVPQPGNPGVQGIAPGGSNPGWVAPTANMASAVQAPAPGNGWTLPTGNPRAPIQGASPRNTNQGWVAQSGNQGTWGSEQHHGGGKFSDQRDKGSQGGDYGFGGGRPWNNGQQSFGGGGQGGPPRHLPKRQTLCPFNRHGRCKKGASCDYLHG